MELGVAEGNADVDHKYAHFGTWYHSRTDAFDTDIPENMLRYSYIGDIRYHSTLLTS